MTEHQLVLSYVSRLADFHKVASKRDASLPPQPVYVCTEQEDGFSCTVTTMAIFDSAVLIQHSAFGKTQASAREFAAALAVGEIMELVISDHEKRRPYFYRLSQEMEIAVANGGRSFPIWVEPRGFGSTLRFTFWDGLSVIENTVHRYVKCTDEEIAKTACDYIDAHRLTPRKRAAAASSSKQSIYVPTTIKLQNGKWRTDVVVDTKDGVVMITGVPCSDKDDAHAKGMEHAHALIEKL